MLYLEQSRLSYIRERNYRVSLLRKTNKKEYYTNSNEQYIVYKTKLRRPVKPFVLWQNQVMRKLFWWKMKQLLHIRWKKFAELSNISFLTTVENLKIPEFNFYDGGLYHIENSPLICSANQKTGFYVIGTSVMKKLMLLHLSHYSPVLLMYTTYVLKG